MRLRTARGWVSCWLASSLAIVLFGCGGGDRGDEGVKKPFKPVSQTTTLKYNVQRLSGDAARMDIRREGSVEFNGATWDDFRGTYDVDQGVKHVHLYGKLHSPTRATIAGYRVAYPAGSSETNYTVTFDQPQEVDAGEIPLDVSQEREISGRIEFDGGGGTITGKVRARYTKTDDNATVASEIGAVSGVQVFEGDMTLLEGEGWSVLDLFRGQTVAGKVWFHPTFGILKIEVKDWPLGMALTGSYDCGNPFASDYNTIQKVGVVSAQNPSFELSSFGCSGDFDADKMRHALMLLELRWADEDKAKTPQKPEVHVSFETVSGYFPFALLSSNASIFHPEENKKGYTYWYALVDQGARNEPGDNGISYGIRVTFPDYMTSRVRVTARIRYPIYRP